MSQTFLDHWAEAALTTLSFFWMAFWAFGLGYTISAIIKTFVTEARMKRSLGGSGAREVSLATFFGFVSSSCSFAALSATRSIFAKGASLSASLAFLLASTNLVVELGIVIAVFLGWQFVVGEYVGGVLLILVVWGLLRAWKPNRLIEEAREAVEEGETDEVPDWRKLVRSREGWAKTSQAYVGEWLMVWKDVAVGFTVAGVIAAFVPPAFFRTLFVGSGSEGVTFWEVVAQTVIGPVAAFFTFIGSMGNIPLAAVLHGSGVSFAGVMAFIFSDLVVFPVLRIQAKYYGWRFALFVAALFMIAIIAASVILHYGFSLLGLLPDATTGVVQQNPVSSFEMDYTFWLNAAFLAVSLIAVSWTVKRFGGTKSMDSDWVEKTLFILAIASAAWLFGGIGLWATGAAQIAG